MFFDKWLYLSMPTIGKMVIDFYMYNKVQVALAAGVESKQTYMNIYICIHRTHISTHVHIDVHGCALVYVCVMSVRAVCVPMIWNYNLLLSHSASSLSSSGHFRTNM